MPTGTPITTGKTAIAKWLFLISLVAGSFSFTGAISQSSSPLRATGTEQLVTPTLSEARSIRYHTQLVAKNRKSNFQTINRFVSCDHERVETIRFHRMQNIFSSIKKIKLASVIKHCVTISDEHNSSTPTKG